MAGTDQLDLLSLQPAQRIHVGGQRAAVGRDEGRALAEDEIAAEADAVLGQEASVVGGVARRRKRTQAAVLLAVAYKDPPAPETLGAGRVIAVAVGEQDEADPAALLGGDANRIEMSSVV